MKAIITHDNITSTIRLSIGEHCITYIIPPVIEEIRAIVDYEDGFITMQTNYGEEYTDVVNIVKKGLYTDNFKQKFLTLLESITLKDIILKRY